MSAKFQLGQLVATIGASEELNSEDIAHAIRQHLTGDWGELCDEDKHFNDEALLYGYRLVSKYMDRSGTYFYIITESDRSVTTVLLPEEY